MLHHKLSQIIVAVFFTAGLAASSLSDSLLIEGYYSQGGQSISRQELESFLDRQKASESLSRRSKRVRWTARGVGASMWCVNMGITAYQLKGFIDAVQNQQPVSTNLDNVTIPLVIGGEIATFIQGRLSTHSDYLLHKAVTAYNNDVFQKQGTTLPMDHRITKAKSNWYMQDRVLMPTRVLYPVLGEKAASRSYAHSSVVFRELANQSLAIGSMFLGLAAIGYLEKDSIDITERNFQLRIGIGLTSFGIMNKIISVIMRNTAIRKYNEARGRAPGRKSKKHMARISKPKRDIPVARAAPAIPRAARG